MLSYTCPAALRETKHNDSFLFFIDLKKGTLPTTGAEKNDERKLLIKDMTAFSKLIRRYNLRITRGVLPQTFISDDILF
jgi:hypothetical protein